MSEAINQRWLAVSCKQRQEAVAVENLERQGFHVYYPRIRVKKRRRGRLTEEVEGLFPRYLFIRIDVIRCSTACIRSTRGAVGLVRFGLQPAVIPDDVIAELRQRENPATGLHDWVGGEFLVGDGVTVVEGPLSGLDGIFAGYDGDKRVTVLLDLLGKSNRVSIDGDWIVQAA
jgi:transcriptional antiterminator RfaH